MFEGGGGGEGSEAGEESGGTLLFEMGTTLETLISPPKFKLP